MKIFFSKQNRRFPKHLAELRRKGVMSYKTDSLPHDITGTTINAPWERVRETVAARLLNYEVFPTNILIGYGEWQQENRTIKSGDTIVQQVYLPSIPGLSAKLIFGVRVKEVINETDRIEFSYETLHGHAERGMSAFRIKRIDNSSCRFEIETWSDAGNLLSSLGKYVFTLPYQAYCKRAALKRIKKQLEAI
jgi:uncharacterized protein (UPF0548 family)